MDQPHYLRAVVFLLPAIMSIGPAGPSGLRAQATDLAWDITLPRGKTRVIDFTTDEGTWMSVDISPDGRWIVFDLLGHVYRIRSSGGETENLTESSGIAINFHPRFSPDGAQIAFISDRAGQENVWVMNSDGSSPRPLLLDRHSRFIQPKWMPDGRRVVVTRRFQSDRGLKRYHDRLWILSADGGEGSELTGSMASLATWPSPSPEGRFVYFDWSDNDGQLHNLRRADLRAGTVENVTEPKGRSPLYGPPLDEIAPEVSPDGRFVAFARRLPATIIKYGQHEYAPRTALWLRNLETGDERLVMDPISSDVTRFLAAVQIGGLPGYGWARDGMSIVLSQGGKLRRLWLDDGRVETIPFKARVHRVVSEQARARVRLTDEPFVARALRWPSSSADGKWLAFEAAGRVWLKQLPHGNPRRLTLDTTESVELTPAFSPDGQWVAYSTWHDGERGHLWKANLSGGAPMRLTARPGTYLHPSWAPAGDSLFVNQRRGQFATEQGLGYELLQVAANGSGARGVELPCAAPSLSATADLEAAHPARPARRFCGPAPLVMHPIGPGGSVFYLERRSGERRPIAPGIAYPPPETLLWSRTPGRGEALRSTFLEHLDQVAPSPDGQWVAFLQWQNIYLTRLPPDGQPRVSPDSTAPGVTRLSRDGASYVGWRNATTVEWTHGDRYFTYDTGTERFDTVRVDLRVSQDLPQGTVALTGARIIPMNGDRVIERGTIVVRGARILCVGDCPTAGADRVIDVRGYTILPGFIDVHHHHRLERSDGLIPIHRARSAALLSWGVTTAQEPGTFVPEPTYALVDLVRAGRIVGARTFNGGGHLLDWGDMHRIRRYGDAELSIAREADRGALLLKSYQLSDRTQRQMVVEAARQRAIGITAENNHVFQTVSFVMDGYTGTEHATQLVPTYSDFARFLGQAGFVYSAQAFLAGFYDDTSIRYWTESMDVWNDPRVRQWSTWQGLAPKRHFDQRPLREYTSHLVGQAALDVVRAGGRAVTGGHGEEPGADTQWELWSLGLAMPPLEALRAATLSGAWFLGLEQDLGSIEVGKLADLVVLRSNPLENIRNTADIRFVMQRGRVYDASTLDEVWPRARPYGPRPWIQADMYRANTRPGDFHDRR